MKLIAKFFYLAAVITVLMHAPGKILAMSMDSSDMFAQTASYSSGSYTATQTRNEGYGYVCKTLGSIQATSMQAGNAIEAQAVGFYKSIVGNAGRRAGYGQSC